MVGNTMMSPTRVPTVTGLQGLGNAQMRALKTGSDMLAGIFDGYVKKQTEQNTQGLIKQIQAAGDMDTIRGIDTSQFGDRIDLKAFNKAVGKREDTLWKQETRELNNERTEIMNQLKDLEVAKNERIERERVAKERFGEGIVDIFKDFKPGVDTQAELAGDVLGLGQTLGVDTTTMLSGVKTLNEWISSATTVKEGDLPEKVSNAVLAEKKAQEQAKVDFEERKGEIANEHQWVDGTTLQERFKGSGFSGQFSTMDDFSAAYVDKVLPGEAWSIRGNEGGSDAKSGLQRIAVNMTKKYGEKYMRGQVGQAAMYEALSRTPTKTTVLGNLYKNLGDIEKNLDKVLSGLVKSPAEKDLFTDKLTEATEKYEEQIKKSNEVITKLQESVGNARLLEIQSRL